MSRTPGSNLKWVKGNKELPRALSEEELQSLGKALAEGNVAGAEETKMKEVTCSWCGNKFDVTENADMYECPVCHMVYVRRINP